MVESKPARTLLARLAPWLRFAITAGVIAFLATKVNWPSLAHRFASAHPWWLGAALLVTLASILMCGTRFFFLLRLQNMHLSYFRTLQLTFVGFFFNLFLIGSTGGDAVRLFYLIRWFPQQKARATLSILLDRVFGVAALFGLALLFLPGTADRLRADPTFAPLASALPWLGPLGAFLLVLGFLLPTFLPNLPIPKKLPGRAILIDLIHGLRDTMHGGWNTVAAVLVAISVHLLSFLGATLLARALDLPISYSLAGLILVLIFSASALPISVSGHGVREGVMIFLFLHLGLGTDPESAIAYSILIYGLGLFWSLLGGLAYLTLRSPRSQP
ncbi:MAG: hypothetical protein ABS32_05900 [Verrucomicrobia subdivision 6 bacterium BACL9 MAG-120820-bin42]|uniref:Lysylphosphatidylglycerol synthetase n=1 Tax=Verrucomicrobia subdivision 6 bacterium BACL9 MAG-120820-bin42 TaxID=1655634 RepID=A0A0R2XD85_9BACT|nr:MAG: hypothetical protein ABS32_05900 [Verrucomicrobia subdivision 6 bacterium BACL9 MAG-120820-bin42]